MDKKGSGFLYYYKLTFQLEKNWLPREIDKLMVSFLKASTQAYSQDFYKELYNKKASIIKGFTYSYFLPGAKFSKERIELQKNEFLLFFSDVDQIERLRFFNSFQKIRYRKYPLDGNSMELVSIHRKHLNEIKENEIIIKMQSPLIVRKHNSEDNSDMYYTCEMDGFERVLKDNINMFLSRMKIDAITEDFSVQVIKGKKVVVPVFGRNTDASLGIFKLTGSCQLLNILYLAGMGARRSEGHGMFEVIG